ncbi:MAG: PAS domain S-box protein [Nitrospirae bacterium]|nr:PAS domain S-box protein [Nitrospirota bacterium]
MEVLLDTTQRMKAEEELLRTKDFLQRIIDNSTNAIYSIDLEGRFTLANNKGIELTGYTMDESIGMPFSVLFAPDTQPMINEQFVKVSVHGETVSQYEVELIRKDQSKRIISFSAAPVYKEGVIEAVIGTAEDITERKRMEMELSLQGEIMTNMEEGVVLVKAGDSTIIFANPKFNSMFGYAEGEMIGRDISIVHAPTDLSPKEMAKQIQFALKETGSWQGEVLHIKKDGTRFWCQVVISTFKHNNYGTVWVAIHQDITKRKEAENQALEVGQRLLAIIDNSPNMIFLKDTEGKYLLVNSQFEKLCNITRAEVIGKTDYYLSPTDVADACRKSDNDALTSLKPVQSIESSPGEDNVIHVLLSTKFPIFDASEQVCGVCGISTDITELKRNEEIIKLELALKASFAKVSEALLNPELDKYDISKLVYEEARLLTGAKHGYATIIEQETGDAVSANLTNMLGTECRVTKNDPARFPKGPDGYPALWGHSLNTNESFYTNDPKSHPAFKNCAPVGHVPIEQFLSVPVLSGDNLIGQIALANPQRDFNDCDLEIITRLASLYAIALERKKMEEALRKSEDLFKTLATVAPVGIYQSDAKGQAIYVNERWCDMTGMTVEESLGNGWVKAVHPDDLSLVTEEWRRSVSTLVSFKSIHRFRHTNGKIILAYVLAHTYCDKHGNYAGYVGAIMDMTEQMGISQFMAASTAMSDIYLGLGPKGGVPLLTNDSPLAALIDLRSMERILLNFTNIIGIPAAIIDLEGKVLASTPWQRLCTGFHRINEKTCERCIESDTSLALSMQQGKKVAIYNCRNGLTDAAAPIIVNGHHMANLFIGQFLRSKPDEEFFRRQAIEFGFDEAQYLDALKEVPIVPEEKIQHILSFMETFASMIISTAEEKLHLQGEVLKNIEQERLLIQQSKMAAMGEMIGLVAHQWKQPLNAVGITIQDLKDAYTYGEVDDKYIDNLIGSTMKQINFMSKTIDDFRNFFVPSKEKILFNIKINIEELLSMFAHVFGKSDIDVSVETGQDALLLTEGYPNEFKQVILNILNNSKDAIVARKKFYFEIKGSILISIGTNEDKSKIIVSIRDNGGGIPDEMIRKIFEPYYTTKGAEGTGIGLYMSKTIIETNMGGSLTVRNIDGGAEFVISLDVYKPDSGGTKQ